MAQLTYPIVGMSFRPPALQLTQVLPVGARLMLRREPTNRHDPNAIAVWCDLDIINDLNILTELGKKLKDGAPEEFILSSEWQLGYLPAGVAAWLARNADVPNELEATFYVGNTSTAPHARFDLDVKTNQLPPQPITVTKRRRFARWE